MVLSAIVHENSAAVYSMEVIEKSKSGILLKIQRVITDLVKRNSITKDDTSDYAVHDTVFKYWIRKDTSR